MPFHDIMVHLDRTEHSSGRLEMAAALASRLAAGLIGLRLEIHPHIPEAFRGGIRPAALETQAKAIADDTARIEAEFRAAAQRHGIPAEWWLEVQGSVAALCQRARYAGVTVVGPRAQDGEEELPGDEVLHQLLLTSGRPVLVVPDTVPAAPPGSRVAVAWNGTRESARALGDSMPFLRHADKVQLIQVRDHAPDGVDGLAEACRHLTRCGIQAEFKTVRSGDHNPGRHLLQAAADFGADLLVSGGYGHSRMIEIVLGGATRWLLDHATIPVLMSH